MFDVDGGCNVEAAGIHEIEGDLVAGDPGGLDTDRILEVTGQLSKEEAIAAFRRGCERRGFSPSPEMEEELRRLSEKESRTI